MKRTLTVTAYLMAILAATIMVQSAIHMNWPAFIGFVLITSIIVFLIWLEHD